VLDNSIIFFLPIYTASRIFFLQTSTRADFSDPVSERNLNFPFYANIGRIAFFVKFLLNYEGLSDIAAVMMNIISSVRPSPAQNCSPYETD